MNSKVNCSESRLAKLFILGSFENQKLTLSPCIYVPLEDNLEIASLK